MVKKILSSKIFLLFIGLCFIYLGISTVKETYKRYELKKEIGKLKQKIANLEEKNNQMEELIDYFNQDSFLEKQARIKLNLKKSGEKVMVVPEKPKEKKQEAIRVFDKKEQQIAPEPNWKEWWNYFFNNLRE